MARKSVLKILYATILSFLFTFTFVSLKRFDIQAADPIPTIEWVGGTDSEWETGANWSTGLVPTLTDDVLINLAGTININGTTTVNSLVLGNDTTSTAVILNFAYDAVTSGALTIGGGDLKMYSDTQITHSAGTSAIVGRINIEVTSGNFTIDSGASINVDGKGYSGGNGYVEGGINGAGQSDSSSNRRAAAGGGHAGYGGDSSTGRIGGDSYGNPLDPITLGSGGGNVSGTGGAGGGVVKISLISGSFNLSGGTIYARGIGGSVVSYARVGGGGAGGSINISAESINITDSGIISSRGGNSNNGTYISRVDSGVGSGGYVYLEYSLIDSYDGFDVDVGTGIPTTQAGKHGSGGIYVTKNKSNDYADMQLRNGNNLYYGINAKRFTFSSPMQLNSLYIKEGALLDLLTTITLEEIYLTENGILYLPPEAVVNAQDITWATDGLLVDRGGSFPLLGDTDLTIPVGAMINIDVPKSYVNGYIYGTVSHSENTSSFDYKLDLTFSGDLNIYSGGSLNVDGKGYSSGNGYVDGEIAGAGQIGGTSNANAAGGGGHGGVGSNSSTGRVGGDSYGDNENPVLPGSAGGTSSGGLGGAGGGVILLNVAGNITLSESSISANGGNPLVVQYARVGGGGSGGTLNLTTSRLYGDSASSITAVGGIGEYGNYGGAVYSGAGGGGRISLTYSYSGFLGDISSDGGTAALSTYNGSDGTIYLNQTNQMPEVDPLDIIPTQHGNIYPGNTVIVDTIYSDPDGQANLDQLYFVVQNPAGQDIILSASNSAVELLDQTPTVGSGSTYLSSYSYSIYPDYGDVTQVKIEWQFNTTWNWERNEDIRYGIKATDLSASDTGYVYNTTNYKYENRLNLDGTLSVANTSTSQAILSGDWVLPGTELTWTGLKVVFEGTTDIYPSNTDFNVKVEDEYGSFWVDGNSSGSNFSLNTTAYEDTDSENIYTVEITDIPTGGSDISNISFTIRTDGNNPEITNFSSTTHPSDTSWYALDTVTVEWVVEDNGSGVAFTHIYVSDQEEETEENILTEGELETELTWTSTELEDGIWYLHLLVEDNVGNRTTGSIKVRIDTSIPDIVKVNGNYDGVWQNIDSGPVISWTKPNSLSGDMFYVTTNGTTPNAINFVYATNQNSYNLPNLGQGEHQIRVVARNGAGTYGFVKSFVVRYDSIPPSRVQNLTTVLQSNNDIVLNWSNPSADFAKVILVRKEDGQSQNVLDGTKIYEGALAAYTDTGLASSRTYFYTLWAYDDVGNQSEQTSTSVTTRDLIPPEVVTQLNAEKVEGGVRVTWRNPPDGDFSKVILSRNNQRIYEGRAQAFSDSSIGEQGTYRYSITAHDNSGNASRAVTIDFVYVIEEPVLTTTTPSPSTTEGSKSSISVKQNEKVEIKVPVNKLQLTEDDVDAVERVVMVIGEIEYEMTLSEDRRYYVTVVDTPSVAGQYIANTKVIRDGEVFSVYDIDVSVESLEEDRVTTKNIWYIVGGILLLGGFAGGFVILKRKK